MLLQYIRHSGSEFDVVIMLAPASAPMLLTRNLLYTGITRAKSKLIMLGESSAFTYSIENTNEYVRKTALLERLKM